MYLYTGIPEYRHMYTGAYRFYTCIPVYRYTCIQVHMYTPVDICTLYRYTGIHDTGIRVYLYRFTCIQVYLYTGIQVYLVYLYSPVSTCVYRYTCIHLCILNIIPIQLQLLSAHKNKSVNCRLFFMHPKNCQDDRITKTGLISKVYNIAQCE